MADKIIQWEFIVDPNGKPTHVRSWTGSGWLFSEWNDELSDVRGATVFVPDPEKKWTLVQTTTPPVVEPPVVTPPVVVPPPVEVGETRPAGNTGKGLFVKNGKLYDANGMEFIMHGMNHTLWWGWKEHNTEAIPEIGKAGANTIRLVFGSNMGHTTVAEKEAAFAACVKAGMVINPGLWYAPAGQVTGAASADLIKSAFAYWTLPEHVALLKKYEQYIVLNPANEWGDFNDGLFVQQYSAGIAKLRSAGVNCAIMVDASGAFGQNVRSILNVGETILAADPQKNVIFSVHLYAYHRSPDNLKDVGKWNDAGLGTPWDTITELKKIQAKKIPVIVGEIGHSGPQAPYNSKLLLQEFKKLGIGWLAWSWNQNSDSALDMFKVNGDWLYPNDTVLSAGGLMFITDPEVGFKAVAKKATNLRAT